MNKPNTLPAYADLPYNDALRGRTSWGVFGEDDNLGTIGLIGNDEVVAARNEIVRGERFSLSLPLNEPDPPPGGRKPFVHEIFRTNRNTQDDRIDGLFLQGSTQWDGLRHIQAREFGFYNGVCEADAGPGGTRLGIDHWAEHGIVGRCVLADVARWAEAQGKPIPPRESSVITPQDLVATLSDQGVEVKSGDVLLLRTGYLTEYLATPKSELGDWDYRKGCPGLAGTEEMAELLWDWHIAAVCADTPAVETRPGDAKDGSLHRRCIAMLGLALGELFVLDSFAADCVLDGRYSAFFSAVPLNLPGGIGSPANALACK